MFCISPILYAVCVFENSFPLPAQLNNRWSFQRALISPRSQEQEKLFGKHKTNPVRIGHGQNAICFQRFSPTIGISMRQLVHKVIGICTLVKTLFKA